MPDYLTNQKTVGEKLRELRIQSKLSTVQISQELKIRAEYLDAIEEGNYKVFSSEVYIKGFLRNYAEYLGMDKAKALSLYRRERENIGEEQTIQRYSKKNLPRPNPFSLKISWSSSTVILGIVGIVSLIVFIGYQFIQITQKPLLLLSEPVLADASQIDEVNYDTSFDSLTISGEIDVGNSLFLNNEQVDTHGLGEFELSNLDIEPGENEYKLLTRNQFGVESEITLRVVR